MEQHFWHLNITCPCCNPILWIISLVAFPRGTAPYKLRTLDVTFLFKTSWIKQFLTGSVSMVLICETKARVESERNNSRLNTPKSVCVPSDGKMITKKDTYIAYRMRNHVRTAQIIPQISCMHQNRPEQHRLCMSISEVNPRPELTSILKSSSRCCCIFWNRLLLLLWWL